MLVSAQLDPTRTAATLATPVQSVLVLAYWVLALLALKAVTQVWLMPMPWVPDLAQAQARADTAATLVLSLLPTVRALVLPVLVMPLVATAETLVQSQVP